ncbi:autophagy- protein 2 [Maudiozyma exigua]|uniref:Autophagy-related protein 2 n=1 Tax=Maudiozyma exigua TaxID=34358 RepID=A0A9P6WCD3_MAUEX|nr:autophagy- protein 2 [Kazachstania exigua]
MVFGWSQNIQRRLLLYMVQQISLFSNLDLTNLDVSLGTSSTFTFTDIDLSVSDVNIPNIKINSGTVGKLTLQLTVSGGLDIKGSDVSLDITLLDLECRDISNTADDDSILPNLLLKSMHDLTSSVIQFNTDPISDNKIPDLNDISEGEPLSTEDSWSESDKSKASLNSETICDNSTKNSQPTRIQNMKNKVLGTILSKLTLNLNNINASVSVQDKDYSLSAYLENIQLLTTEQGIRNIIVSSFELFQQPDEEIDSDSNEEMNESMYYSKMGGTSIYMSAMDIPHSPDVDIGSVNSDTHNGKSLFKVTDINVCFKGLSSVDDVSITDLMVDITEINLNEENILHIDTCLASYLYRIFDRNSKKTNDPDKHLETQKIIYETLDSESYKRFQDAQHIISANELSYMCINKFAILLSKDIILELKRLYINQLENRDYTIELNSIKLLSNGKEISKHDGSVLKVIVTSKAYDIRVLTALNVSLTSEQLKSILYSIQDLKSFVSNISSTGNVRNRLGTKKILPQSRSTILITEDVSISLILPQYKLSILVDPISYDSHSSVSTTSAIRFVKHDDNIINEIITASDITYNQLAKSIERLSYNETLTQVIMTGNNICNIKSISLRGSRTCLEDIIEDVKEACNPLLDDSNSTSKNVNNVLHSRSSKERKNYSNMKKSSLSVSLILEIDVVKIKVNDTFVGSNFGNIKGKMINNLLAFSFDTNDILFHSKQINLERICSSGLEKQNIFEVIRPHESTKPTFVFLTKKRAGTNCLKIILNNIQIQYDCKWIDLLKDSINTPVAGESSISSLQKHAKSKNIFEVEFKMHDSSLTILPFRLDAELLLLLDQCTCNYSNSNKLINGVIKTTSVLLIDDSNNKRHYNLDKNSKSLLSAYSQQGFVTIGKIGIFKVCCDIAGEYPKLKLLPDSIELSLCADSLNCLIQLLLDLKFPETFPDEMKYKTELSTVINTFKDINFNFLDRSNDVSDDKIDTNIGENSVNLVENFLDSSKLEQKLSDMNSLRTESTEADSEVTGSLILEDNYIDNLNPSNLMQYNRSFNSSSASEVKPQKDLENVKSEVKLGVANINIKLYDGYDWKHSRKLINDTVLDFHKNAYEDDKLLPNDTPENTSNLKVSLFDSIYITKETKKLPSTNWNDTVNPQVKIHPSKYSKMNLRPSKNYQVLLQLSDLEMSLVCFIDGPAEQEQSESSPVILNDLQLRIKKFEIVDNIASSSWNKFATNSHRYSDSDCTDMLNLNFLITKPISYLRSIDYMIDLSIAPLRLHIDQDTLDFITRIIEFKDSRFKLIDDYPEVPFVNKFHLSSIHLTVDYKPKVVDYTSLRSGHTSEFMNFFVLEGSKLTLKEVTFYALNGFDSLNSKLKEIWTPDIIKRQLGGVVSGIAPMKSFFSIGSDVKTFVTVLLDDYKSGQPMTTSLRKNGNVFVKTTTGDFIKLGVKLSNGTQAILESAEAKSGGQGINGRTISSGVEETNEEAIIEQLSHSVLDYDKLVQQDQLVGSTNVRVNQHEPSALVIEPGKKPGEEAKIISLYADQPLDIHRGLEEAYSSLEKHLNIAYDTVWKNSQQKNHSENENRDAKVAAVSAMKVAPIAIIRPLIGVTEALSKTFQGISNQVDKKNIQDVNDKYKTNRKD